VTYTGQAYPGKSAIDKRSTQFPFGKSTKAIKSVSLKPVTNEVSVILREVSKSLTVRESFEGTVREPGLQASLKSKLKESIVRKKLSFPNVMSELTRNQPDIAYDPVLLNSSDARSLAHFSSPLPKSKGRKSCTLTLRSSRLIPTSVLPVFLMAKSYTSVSTFPRSKTERQARAQVDQGGAGAHPQERQRHLSIGRDAIHLTASIRIWKDVVFRIKGQCLSTMSQTG